MKTIDFSEFYKGRYAITDISVIDQTNLWSVCDHAGGRIYNGFILFKNGSCNYEWNGNRIPVGKGTLIYLPTGSKHKVTAKERSLNFYRINFTVRDVQSGEIVVFSDTPKVITQDTPMAVFGICENMCRWSLSDKEVFKNLSAIAEILDFVLHNLKSTDISRISPAVEYIENHFTEDFTISALANICYISEAHLFRLFKEELGTSPVEYKNILRIKRAQQLLCDPECSIGDISAMVGFENLCYFSRTFKKIVGYNPSQYRNTKDKK